MEQLPTSVYVVVGIMVITNLSTLGALIVFIFKVGMFVARTEHGIKDAKEKAVRAHQRIDTIEKAVNH